METERMVLSQRERDRLESTPSKNLDRVHVIFTIREVTGIVP